MFEALNSRGGLAAGPVLTRRDWFRILALLPAAGLALGRPPDAEEAFATGKPSPPLQVTTLDGQVLQIDKQAGKVVLVDFMTTTCPTCKKAAAGIQQLYREFGSKGFLPVALAIDPQAANVLPIYRNLYELTFPVAVVARDDVIRYLAHPANKPMLVPTLVLLDKRGRIVSKKVGWTDDQELRSAIAGLLNEKKK